MRPINRKIKVGIIEVEEGNGQRLAETKFFNTRIEAEGFVKEYNAPGDANFKKSKKRPKWYAYAEIIGG